jgi:hypothetical protein
MSIELDRPGGGVAALMLSFGTLLALEKNGTLSNDEVADIAEQSLARLRPSMRRRACEARRRGAPLSIFSSNFARGLPVSEAGNSSTI